MKALIILLLAAAPVLAAEKELQETKAERAWRLKYIEARMLLIQYEFKELAENKKKIDDAMAAEAKAKPKEGKAESDN